MTAQPKVSIIVISFNTKEMTLDCLRSVIAETSLPYELIVVDNASDDGSAEAIAAEFPGIKLLAETQNHGFALANNIAITHAIADYVLLLNPDTVVLDQAIDRLFAFSQQMPEARIWGGRTVFGDHSLSPASCWARMTLWSIFCRSTGLASMLSRSTFFNPEAMGGWLRDTVRHVDIVTGCFLLISRSDWDALCGFDEAFFMYGEEADLCLRASSELNARPLITPHACIVHYGGASEKAKADKMVRLLSAKIELIHRHFPKWQWPIARALLALWPLSRAWGLSAIRPGSDQASTWNNIWHRRHEWEQGFKER